MSYASVTYTGNGSSTSFAITFPYIQTSHISVYVSGVLKVYTTDYTIDINNNVVFTSAPANGAPILIARSSNPGSRLVTFQDASVLTAALLNQDSNQLLYVVQEAFDGAFSALNIGSDGVNYDAKSKKIINVADPVNSQDAMTKAYADGHYGATTATINDSSVTTSKLADGAVTAQKITDATITGAKLAAATIAAGKLIQGTGSGVDADLLDGQHGSYYATQTDVTNLQTAIAGAGITGIQVFSTAGTTTYTKPGTLKSGALVFCTAGGGSGAFGTTNFKSGGSAGGTSLKFISAASLTSTVSVTVGAGGAAQTTSGSSGNAGNSSSFGAYCSANGGAGGLYSASGTPGPDGGTSSGGNVNMRGAPGVGVEAANNAGPGGASFWGGAGKGASSGTNGSAGIYGGGGGGGDSTTSGKGGDGIVVVIEF